MRRLARLVAWSSVALCFVIVGVTAVLIGVAPGDLGGLSIDVAMLATACVGALIATRRPENPIGWLLCASGLGWVLSAFGQEYTAAAVHQELGAAGAVSWLIGFWGLSAVCLALATIVFPDGRLPSRMWRPIVWVAIVDVALLEAGTRGFTPLGTVGGSLLASLLVSAVVALFVRFRPARGVERQQLKWVALGFAFLTIVFIGTTAFVKSPFGRSLFGDRVPADALPVPFAIAYAALPLSIGIAILRHRLYDIDVLISRSLVYGVLSATLAATYFLIALALETVLRPITAGSEVAVALSTLAVVALFAPLRGRIRAAVDRRFYRARYDAARTLDAFGEQLRDEVDLEAVEASLLGAVEKTMRPAHATIWLRNE
jgi:hypothetical protein